MCHKMQRKGRQTVFLKHPVTILETAAIVGKKEGEGPLSDSFDRILEDDCFGEKSWEKAETKLQRETILLAIKKAGLKPEHIDYAFSGDLLNQCIGAEYAMRELSIPFFGLYGACSTMTEGLTLAALVINGGTADYITASTSSHFCAAEKQYRLPLEYGGQRTPSAQWTVTGAGCAVLAREPGRVQITHLTTGRVVDFGVTDANNMGAAMAPAAADTLKAHFRESGFSPSDYDLILTGDLGEIGSDLLCDIMNQEGYDIYTQHQDCGLLIFDRKRQDVHAGGSGCGCCASVFCGHVFPAICRGEYRRILVMATGALMNPQIVMQGESIPGIAHAVTIERKDG